MKYNTKIGYFYELGKKYSNITIIMYDISFTES